MQILYAAPFILAAGLIFTVLSVIPVGRKWAIPIPTGVIAAGPSSLACFFLVALVREHLAQSGPVDRWDLVAYIGGGVIGGIVAGVLAYFVTCLLPRVILTLAVFLAAGCSYFVLIVGSLLAAQVRLRVSGDRSTFSGLLVICVEMLISFIAAFFVAQKQEQFRPRRVRIPSGMSFPNRRASDLK